jgi:DNA-binding CsgD family transcriptional regulator
MQASGTELERGASPTERLTPRERECLRLVARGYGTKGIALQLNLSSAHVAKVIHSANRKLHVSSRMDAARLLAEHEGHEVFVVGPTMTLRDERLQWGEGRGFGSPLRRRGERSNDLTFWQRLTWIAVLAAIGLIGVGTLSSGLGSLSDKIILVPTRGAVP